MKIDFPSAFEPLFQPARYKVFYGGRGGAKSWAFARALLIKGRERRLRVLCARETMNSIADSVHKLLEDQIEFMGMQPYYNVLKSSIVGSNGTEFAFAGLRHNVSQIKSYESFDIAWVEEAQSVSRSSFEVLIPTIRKDDSQIWISFNPELESDDVWRRFILHPPPDCTPRKVTYRDNPWFPEVLRTEMEFLKQTDPDAYNHVWEGCCVQTVEGAVYADELRKVDAEGRICQVAYDPFKPVDTAWDLGYADCTSIWMFQWFPREYRMIDYIEGSGRALKYYLGELQSRSYLWGKDYLPHDARAKNLATGKSIEEMMRAAGRNVQIVLQLSVADGLNAARTIFPLCWFDADKCADGLQALRHYRYAPILASGVQKREPMHDIYSHGADAYRTMAVGVKAPASQKAQPAAMYPYQPEVYSGVWS